MTIGTGTYVREIGDHAVTLFDVEIEEDRVEGVERWCSRRCASR